MSIAWIVVFCFFSYLQSDISLFTHSSLVKATQKKEIPCTDTPKIITTRLPQQRIKIKNSPKKFSYIWPISRKGHYIKVASGENVSEFIIRKENCPKKLKKQLTLQEAKAFANNKIVRFYHKKPVDKIWSAIATLPEQQAHKIISKATVHPDGSIRL